MFITWTFGPGELKIGIDGNLLSWVTDYLDDRKQNVVLDGFSSGWEGIDAGVPQGSVLGPFLFPYIHKRYC
jgi:hypothetical protein